MQEHISEAEYLYSIEDYFDEFNHSTDDLYTMYDIKEDRKRRISNLIGKYIVVCDGKSSKKQVYLQDREVSRGGYWTQFLSNAKGFKTKTEALRNKDSFKYGNPRVYLMDNNKSLMLIK